MTVGGVLDESIPEHDVERRLANEGGTQFDVPPILEALRKGVGWWRMVRTQGKTSAQIIQQVRGIRDDSLALYQQLLALDPAARALIGADVREWPEGDLIRLHAAATTAHERMGSPRTGPPAQPRIYRDKALRGAYAAIRNHSHPRMREASARALAADLLRLCAPDLHIPSDKDQLRKITG